MSVSDILDNALCRNVLFVRICLEVLHPFTVSIDEDYPLFWLQEQARIFFSSQGTEVFF